MNTNIELTIDETLNHFVKNKLAEIDARVCKVMYARGLAILGYAGLRRQGQKLLGKFTYRCAITEKRMSSPRQMANAAARLHMRVILLLERPGKRGRNCPLYFEMDKELTRSTLLSFMQAIHKSPCAQASSPALRRYQRDELKRISQNREPIRWKSLIAFFAACGYELNVWLEDTIPASEASLLSRLNYPV